MPRETFYVPTTGGDERTISERLHQWAQLRADNDSTTPVTD
jgi:putative ATPase